MIEKYQLILNVGSEPIYLQYNEGHLTIYFKPSTHHIMRATLSLFGWGADQPDPKSQEAPQVVGEYKRRAVVSLARHRWEAGMGAILKQIGTTAEMARATRRLVSVKAFGRGAW